MENATQKTHRWTLRKVQDDAKVAALCASLNDLPPALGRSLVLRGIETVESARQWFRGDLEQLHDPFLMADMERAAERFIQAIETGERVLVYGDYDVDGTTATALMVLFLQSMDVEVDFFVPNRFVHGYGLSKAGIDRAGENGATLIVALDCGITAIEEVQYAASRGIDLIICDHHEPGKSLPEAVAVLDPKREDCPYPFDGLSGCGVGFKLVQAVLDRLRRPKEEAWSYLDLVAVSTASDIVPVSGETRFLMRAGLRKLAESPKVGLEMLAERAGVDLLRCSCSSIVFSLGPRINAAGRVDDASIAVRLLTSTDRMEAAELADQVETLNTERRQLDLHTRDEALLLAEAQMEGDPSAIVLHHDGWHPGVIGITASRIAEHFNRPTVLLSTDSEGNAKGSARSVKGFSIYKALASCSDLLTRFGGHAFAAGVTLPVENVKALRDRLSEAIASMMSDPDDLIPELELDAALDLRDIDDRFWNVLEQFAPFGPENPRPLFWASDLKVIGRPSVVGSDGRHLRLRVAQKKGGTPRQVIGFGLGEKLDVAMSAVRRGRPIELAVCVEENTWNGRSSLQLRAKDLRIQMDA